MGCAESAEFSPEEIAKDLYELLQKKDAKKFDELLHGALWHNPKKPDWSFVRTVAMANIVTTSRDWKESLLHYCVRFNDMVFLDLLMNYDPPLHECVNSHGNSVLHTCCVSGCSPQALELLLRDVPATVLPKLFEATNDDGDAPMHLAARNHFGWIVDQLLERGARVSGLVNREGDTALDMVINAQKRNPLSRGNIVVRKRNGKEWWVPETMTLDFIRMALEKAVERELQQQQEPAATTDEEMGQQSTAAAHRSRRGELNADGVRTPLDVVAKRTSILVTAASDPPLLGAGGGSCGVSQCNTNMEFFGGRADSSLGGDVVNPLVGNNSASARSSTLHRGGSKQQVGGTGSAAGGLTVSSSFTMAMTTTDIVIGSGSSGYVASQQAAPALLSTQLGHTGSGGTLSGGSSTTSAATRPLLSSPPVPSLDAATAGTRHVAPGGNNKAPKRLSFKVDPIHIPSDD